MKKQIAYLRGCQAQREGKKLIDNPYKGYSQHTIREWENGFKDESFKYRK